MRIYLAGPITGCVYDECTDWREEFAEQVHPNIKCYSPMRGEDYLKTKGTIQDCYPDEGPFATQRGLMARDAHDCINADVVVANLLNSKIVSIGTCMEIGWCWLKRIPCVVIMEPEGNIHEHPMIRESIDYRVTTIEQAIEVVETLLIPESHANNIMSERR